MQKIKSLEVGNNIYENILVKSTEELIKAAEEGKVIPVMENGKVIYINGAYVVSFLE